MSGSVSALDSACKCQHGDGAFDAAARAYNLYARKAYAQGEQVFLNYGTHTNLFLLGMLPLTHSTHKPACHFCDARCAAKRMMWYPMITSGGE